MRSRQTNHDSRNGSESSEDDSDERSSHRGRTGKQQTEVEAAEEEQVDAQIEALMGENSKSSGA
jgi:choline-phosphate cytidylyltransferase